MNPNTAALPLPDDPLRLARALPPTDPLRVRLEAALARLEGLAAAIVAELDLIEPDPDLEPCGDEELSLGATANLNQQLWGQDLFSCFGPTNFLDAAIPSHDAELDEADMEPWLGSVGSCDPGGRFSQLRWASGGRRDFEEQCEDEGGACEGEGENSDDEGDHQAGIVTLRDDFGRQVWPPQEVR